VWDHNKDHLLDHFYDLGKNLGEEAIVDLSPSFIRLSGIEETYTDMELIGEGALKQVYRCYDQRSQRQVAFATLNPERNEVHYEDFIQEAWLTASLSHPNIIKIYETGVDTKGSPYFVMDLKSNQTLSKLIKVGTDLRTLLEMFLKVCDAMSYAHSKGVIHLDLKPANIQCDRYGEVLVCDWGLATMASQSSEHTSIPMTDPQIQRQKTLYGAIKGTLGYMAPEQTIPGAPKDVRTDIFSLGCILYRILTDHRPFRGTKSEILNMTRECRFTPPREEFPELNIPKSLNAVVKKALVKEPIHRYQSVEALRKDIYNYLHGRATIAERPNLLRRAQLFVHRHKTVTSIVVASAILLSALSSIIYSRSKNLQEEKIARVEEVSSLADKIMGLNVDLTAYEGTLSSSQVRIVRGIVGTAKQALRGELNKEKLPHIDHVLRLLERAEAMREKNENVKELKKELHFMQLNFSSYRNVKQSFTKPNLASQLAQSFPRYNYTLEQRPTTTELTELLETASTLNHLSGDQEMLTRAIYYDWLTRAETDKNGYEQVLCALLEYLNRDLDFEAKYNYHSKTLKIFYGTEFSSYSDSLQLNLLSLYPAHKLKLVGTSFDLNKLDQTSFAALHLTRAGEFINDLSTPINVPNLLRVTIASEQEHYISKLKKILISNEPLKFVKEQ